MNFNRIILSIILTLLGTVARADSVWNYEGNSITGPSHSGPLIPNTCGCSLDGSVTLDANNKPIAWNFTDGLFTLTNLNSTGTISPDPLGPPPPGVVDQPFGFWFVDLIGANGAEIHTNFIGSVTDSVEFAFAPGVADMHVEANPGTWTESPIETPEPAALLLLIPLVLFLLAYSRSRAV